MHSTITAIERFAAARAYVVDGQQLMASLQNTFPGIACEQQGGYFFQCVIQRDQRRAEEMREVAETARDFGLAPWRHYGDCRLHGRARRQRHICWQRPAYRSRPNSVGDKG